jgi:AhpC/TSA family
MTTLLINGHTTTVPAEAADGLWLETTLLESATGWALKPEGACFGERCVPIPHGREAQFISDGRFNLLALAEYLDQPVLRDSAHDIIAVGESAEGRAGRLRSLEAPDFTLPDLEGVMHSLSDYRGRKVFLASWASW